MNTRLDRHTPNLAVIDSRGQPLRQVAYWRRDSSVVAVARVTRSEYDAAGRLVKQRDPRFLAPALRANLQTVYSLSGAALSSDSVDAGWRLSLPAEAQQTLESWDGRGSYRRSEYDLHLRPVALYETMAGQPAHTVERLTYATNATEFAARNQCGQLLRHDDPAGTLLFNQQALTGQVISQTRRFLPDEQAADWPLDIAARDTLLESDKRYTTLQRYSPAGELIEQTDAADHQHHWALDRAGQLKSIALTLKGKSPEPLLTATDFNAEGQLLSQTAANAVVTTVTFEASTGRLLRLSAAAPSKGTLQNLSYEYDPVGNITLQMDHLQPLGFFANQRVEPETTYTYDSLYQLSTARGREAVGASIRPGLPDLISPIDPSLLLNYTQEYEYDEGGNFTVLRHIRAGNNYTRTMRVAQGSNRALPWEEGAPAPDFEQQFDPNGNLKTLVPGAQPMQWDGRNQLQKLTTVNRDNGANDDEYYRYDSSGARVRKVSSAQAKTVVNQREVRYLPGLEIRTLDSDEELQVISVALGRGSVRCLHWVAGKPDQLRYSVDDHLGSSSLELDKNAAVISHEGYYPYGGTAWWAARSQIEADYKTIRYSGKEQDASGLLYYGLRYLAPWLGRWVNPDPLGVVDGLNVFRMVRNNPISLVDDTGGSPSDPAVSIEMNDLAAEPVFFGPNLPENPQDNPPPMPDSWTVWGRQLRDKDYWKQKTEKMGLTIANSWLAKLVFPEGGTGSLTPWIISTAGTYGAQALTNVLHPNPAWSIWSMWPGVPDPVGPDDPGYPEYQEQIFEVTQHHNMVHSNYVLVASATGASLGPLHTLINKRVDEFRDGVIKASKAATKAQGAARMGRIEQEMFTLKLNQTVTEEAQNLLISELLLAEKELGSSSPQTVNLLERLRAMGPLKGYEKDYIPDDFGRRSDQGAHRLGGTPGSSRLVREYGGTRL